MFRPAQVVLITRGFWQGHCGQIQDKWPLLPLYLVYMQQGAGSIGDLPCSHWVWGCQLGAWKGGVKRAQEARYDLAGVTPEHEPGTGIGSVINDVGLLVSVKDDDAKPQV